MLQWLNTANIIIGQVDNFELLKFFPENWQLSNYHRILIEIFSYKKYAIEGQ